MAALDPVKIISLPNGSSYDIVDGTLTAGTGIQISERDSSTGKRTISTNINVGVTDVKVGNTSVVTSGVANLKGAANKDVASNTGTSVDSGKIPALDANGKLDTNVLPAIAITDTFTAASEAAMLALSAQKGDVCVRTDISKTYILTVTPASTKANWQELLFPADAVSSVNGKTGVVTLSASDVGAATSGHTHTTSLASDSGTSTVSLEANKKYKLTAGGTSVIFTTPADTNTHYTNYFSIKTKVSSTETEVAKFIQSGDKTLKIIQGDNITLTPDATNGTITIAASQPTVNNATLTIQKNGTDVATFTANSSTNKTANIAVPTKTSELTNDSNFITTSSTTGLIKNDGTIDTTTYSTFSGSYNDLSNKPTIPAKTSDLTNDRFIRYDTNAQGLNDTQKSNARTNIGAGTSNLTIGTTSSTAAAGNHNHNGTYLTSVTSESTSSTGDIEYIEAVSYDAETGTLTLSRKYLHNNK